MSSALLRAGAEMAVVDPRILPEARPVFDAMLRDSSGNAIALFQVDYLHRTARYWDLCTAHAFESCLRARAAYPTMVLDIHQQWSCA